MKGTPKQLIPYIVNLDDDKIYEVKEYKEKRSLDANAYYWALVNKIAEALHQSKEWVHMCMLKQYGVVWSINVPAEFPIEQYKIKYYELDGVRKNNGKLFKIYKAYMGSSEMNAKQMSVLIDGVVNECHEMGIETMTPDEIAKMKASWG